MAGPLVKAMNELIAKFKEGEKAGKGFWETGFENYLANVRKFYGLKPPEVNTGGATGDFGPGAAVAVAASTPHYSPQPAQQPGKLQPVAASAAAKQSEATATWKP